MNYNVLVMIYSAQKETTQPRVACKPDVRIISGLLARHRLAKRLQRWHTHTSDRKIISAESHQRWIAQNESAHAHTHTHTHTQ